MATNRSGSALGVILGTGGWATDGFKAYLSIQENEEASVNAMLKGIELNFDSGDSDRSVDHILLLLQQGSVSHPA